MASHAPDLVEAADCGWRHQISREPTAGVHKEERSYNPSVIQRLSMAV